MRFLPASTAAQLLMLTCRRVTRKGEQLEGKPEENKNVIKPQMDMESSIFSKSRNKSETWSCFFVSFVTYPITIFCPFNMARL